MDHDEVLAELFGKWKRMTAAGTPCTAEQVCSESPEHVEAFRDALPALLAMDKLFSSDRDETPSLAEPLLELANYEHLALFKEGGLGAVFVGTDAELRRKVAIKCIKSRFHADEGATAQFLEEAEVTARLDHPGVVPIYRLARDGRGRPYYAMRFIEGATLSEGIREFHQSGGETSQHNLAFRQLLQHFIAVCETVAYAHSRGIVHRDLKPENIVLGPFGETLVLDWGLAKSIGRDERDPTASGGPATSAVDRSLDGFAKGSPAYMSPEQARGEWKEVGKASDIYSLGATMYVLLTGHLPYSGSSALHVIEQAKLGRSTPPRQVNRQVPGALDAICCKAMASVAADRYQDAKQLANEMACWLADEPVSAYREPFATRAKRWMRRHRPLVAAGATALVLISFATTGIAFQARRMAATERRAKEDLQRAYEREVAAYQRERKARTEAERNFGLAVDQASTTVNFFHGPELQLFQKHPVYQTVIQLVVRNLEELKAIANAEAADRLSCDIAMLKLHQASGEAPGGFPAELDQRIAETRGLLEAFRVRYPADDLSWRVSLGKTYFLETQRLLLVGRQDEAHERASKAFALFEEGASAKTSLARHSLLCAAAIVALNAGSAEKQDQATQNQLESVLQQLDEATATIPVGSQEHLAFAVTKANLLQANINLLLGSDKQSARDAIQQLQKSLNEWPVQWQQHPLLARAKAFALFSETRLVDRLTLADFDRLSQATAALQTYLSACQGNVNEFDRRAAYFMELAAAQIAVELLSRASPSDPPIAAEKAQWMWESAVNALGVCEALESLVPIEQQDQRGASTIQSLKTDLQKLWERMQAKF